jgi:hypothetical protein
MKKLRLEIIALCNYADFTKSGKFILSGIFDQIYLSALPTKTFPQCYVAFTISGGPSSDNLPIKLQITDPSKKNLIEQEINIPFGKNGKANYAIAYVGLPVENPGLYTISISHKNEKLGFTKFEVLQAPPNEI